MKSFVKRRKDPYLDKTNEVCKCKKLECVNLKEKEKRIRK